MTAERLRDLAEAMLELDAEDGSGFGDEVDDLIHAAEVGLELAGAVLRYLREQK